MATSAESGPCVEAPVSAVTVAPAGPSPALSLRGQAYLFGFALAVRIAFVLAQQYWTVFFGGDLHGPDTKLYRELAQSLRAGLGLVNPGPVGWKESGYPFAVGATAWVMPGYPLFLALCGKLAGDSILAIRIVQSLLGALACVFVARTAAMLFGHRAGWTAGIVAAVYYELIFSVNGIVTEPVYSCLVAWMLYAFIAAAKSRSTAPFALAGLLFGVAALVRPEAFGAAICFALVLAAKAAWRQYPAGLTHGIVFAAVSIAVLVPWGLRNDVVLGRFVMLSTEGGYVLWLGNNPGYDKLASDFTRFGGYSPAAVFKSSAETRGKSELDADRIYRQTAVSHIESHPLRWLARAPHKLWNMWRPAEVTSSQRHLLVAWTTYPMLLGVSVVGLIRSWRIEEVWPLRVFLFANIMLHAFVTGEMRFRIPMWPALIPLAGFGFTEGMDLLRIRNTQAAVSLVRD